MGVLSKTYTFSFNLLGSYIANLYEHPIRTKSMTSCVIATLGNYTAQRLAGIQPINQDTLFAFGAYGLLFGGTIPHFFYEILTRVVSEDAAFSPLRMLLIERLIFMPMYQFFSLYMLSRFEGKSHNDSLAHVSRVYFPVVEANFKYLTLLQYLNLNFVPPILRVFVANIIGFFWVIYIARRRAKTTKRL